MDTVAALMAERIGINGFGRMGRLALRAAWDWPEFEFVHVNELECDAETAAHLLTFDSVHGRWEARRAATLNRWRSTARLSATAPERAGWRRLGRRGCRGRARVLGRLPQPAVAGAVLRARGQKVVVAAPVKEPGALNVVVGVNDELYEAERHDVITAASCTTNCLAPVVKVVHDGIGIDRGSITTLHNLTNTQMVVDAPHKDLRRARAAGQSLIPTTTGSATAIGLIFPELQGKLDGLAVRVPLLNASLTDCVFEVSRPTTVEEVNGLLRRPRRASCQASSDTRSGPWCRSTSATTRARASSTRCRRWSPTTPR